MRVRLKSNGLKATENKKVSNTHIEWKNEKKN